MMTADYLIENSKILLYKSKIENRMNRVVTAKIYTRNLYSEGEVEGYKASFYITFVIKDMDLYDSIFEYENALHAHCVERLFASLEEEVMVEYIRYIFLSVNLDLMDRHEVGTKGEWVEYEALRSELPLNYGEEKEEEEE